MLLSMVLLSNDVSPSFRQSVWPLLLPLDFQPFLILFLPFLFHFSFYNSVLFCNLKAYLLAGPPCPHKLVFFLSAEILFSFPFIQDYFLDLQLPSFRKSLSFSKLYFKFVIIYDRVYKDPRFLDPDGSVQFYDRNSEKHGLTVLVYPFSPFLSLLSPLPLRF